MTTTVDDLARALDPSRYMAGAGFAPDAWQSAFLRSHASRSLLLCARQTGKSTTIAALASHTATYTPGALTLIFAPSQQQSREIFRKVVEFHRGAAEADPDAESAQRVELPNGSRIVSLSGNPTTARGFSGPRLIILDEAAFVEDELFHAVTPMLAAGGRLVAMSTPYGKRGWFWDAWENGGEAWARTRVTATDSPRITPEFLAAETASKPAWRIRQEYYCEFVDTDQQVFGSDTIAAAITPTVAPCSPLPSTGEAMPHRLLRDAAGRPYVDYSPQPGRALRPKGMMTRDPETGQLSLRTRRNPSPTFVIGLDLGQAADFTALVVVQRVATGFNVPMIERVRGKPYTEIVARVADLVATPPLAGDNDLVLDFTGVGRPVLDLARGAGLDPVALTITGGAKLTGRMRAPHVPKPDLIEGLLVAFQAGTIAIAAELQHAATLARELSEMQRKISSSGRPSYGVWRDGEHDDLVLALAMAIWQADRIRPAVVREVAPFTSRKN